MVEVIENNIAFPSPRGRGQGEGQKVYRRKLRQASTPSEKIVWSKLRDRRLGGLKFRRQEGIGKYIVDFLNYDGKIIIEIDGDVHFVDEKNVVKDKERQAWLEEQGWKILRYNNVDVRKNLENILDEIYEITIQRMKALSET